jgi:hypothetical protein
VVIAMARDDVDRWCNSMPDVSNKRAFNAWLAAMPQIESPLPAPVEPPPPAKVDKDLLSGQIRQQRDDLAAFVEEVSELTEHVGGVVGGLERNNAKLTQRVRELELQIAYEKRLRKLENKLASGSVAYLDASLRETDMTNSKFVKIEHDGKIELLKIEWERDDNPAPVIPLRGGRNNAA